MGHILLLIGCTPAPRQQIPELGHEHPTMAPSSDAGEVIVAPSAQNSGEAGWAGEDGQQSLILWMNPSVVDLTVGESRIIQVQVDRPQAMHNVELRIEFDPKYVRVEDSDPNTAGVQIQAGDTPAASQVQRNEVSNESGVIIYHAAQTANSIESVSGMVANFTIRALMEGGSPLRFGFVTLRDENGNPLPTPEWVSGLAIISVDGVVDAPTAQAVSEGTFHVVQPGDTLAVIAQRYNTTIESLSALNGLAEPNGIWVGQVLVLKHAEP